MVDHHSKICGQAIYILIKFSQFDVVIDLNVTCMDEKNIRRMFSFFGFWLNTPTMNYLSAHFLKENKT
jgi:hypothetical protein